MRTVWSTYESILDDDAVLATAQKYSVSDIIKTYGFNIPLSEQLHRLLQDTADSNVISVYSVPAEELGTTIQESIHQSFDGWSDEEKAVIQLYLNDIGRAIKLGRE